MGKFEDIELFKKLRQGKIKLYTALAAYDNFDRKNIACDSLYFEEDIKDETEDVISKIEYMIRKIIAEDFVSGDIVEEFYVKYTPILFYRVDTIDTNPDKVIAETEYLDYYKDYMRIMVEFVTKKRVKGEYATEIIRDEYRTETNPIIATVDFNNFYRALCKIGYAPNYDSFYALARDIIRLAREDDIFPNFNSSVFEEGDTKRYQEDAKLELKLKSL